MNRRADLNGIQTHYRLTGKAGAPTVILSHGLAADLSMWAPQLDMLSRSFSVLCYDIRGHGGTSATPGDYSLALLADDVIALMDSLGIARAHYVGLSLGGMIGQQLGAWHGERLASLTLCATTSNAPKASWDARVHEARAHGIAPLVEATVDRWVTPAFKREQPELMEQMRRMVLGTSLDGYAGSAAAIRDMELAPVLGRIKVPTLVIAGEADTSTPLPILEHIADSIPGATLLTVPEAAHMPTMERPELCNPALERFLLAHSSDQ
ncbi:3-oxoadipate enol-lactonase [Burkholderia sp. Ch1-1]|uniref:Beta-ketoadipate enol-lactone hydrolase n=1 Tax=Paraburkholderia dioscoreae TaxID=2604047 RepID=A0A5Q4ZEK7_9BURK|nr:MULTISPECIES: 3-oxoadipate enol-lactonase [Paraburkholderia]EIF34902.1 3-oxoadipate enol-lactonase [Burkholderia sp. Ch1-1]MDR8396537.1 3-oxoadipate enol-lactonase [Paraburkholderia sp. USG1]VVD34081.1 Beta-ketoadipate enol-lactone hydrolase [Paraburkholderia dioscoreae]